MGKITTLAEILRMRENLRRDRRKLVCTNGCFDLLHRGHLQSLTQAANAGDVLLVLVNADSSVQSLKSPDRPFVGEDDRAALLAALAPVDFVVVFHDRRCDRILAAVEPDVYVKSADYTLATLDPAERAAVEKHGGKIVFAPLVAGLSTSNLVKKIRRSDPEKITAAAFSFLKNPAGEILLVRNRYDDKIRWGLPGGGQIRGESLTAAVVREAREETGLDLRIDGYVGLLERINPRLHLHCHQFAATVVGGELRIDPREEHVIDAAYFSAAKIRDWREPIMGREYLRRYAENAATYPRYVQMGEDEE
ncbi:MAG: NUDIX domain-containing protein [Planctomycetota bacterium]|jgi:rfaE bifunctional protein nucleotidyltransferase chain/domain|nr:NUDIX domain-containing protein [Planctomycetota bacterium]